jgi:hypothetical protein
MFYFGHPFVSLTSHQLVVEQGPTRRAAIPVEYITSIVAAGAVGFGFVLRNLGKHVVYYTAGDSPGIGAAVTIAISLSQPIEVLRGRRRRTRRVVVQVKDPRSFVHALESMTGAASDTRALEPTLARAASREARHELWSHLTEKAFLPCVALAPVVAATCFLLAPSANGVVVFLSVTLGWIPVAVVTTLGLILWVQEGKIATPPVVVPAVTGATLLVVAANLSHWNTFEKVMVIGLSAWVVGSFVYLRGLLALTKRPRGTSH